MRPIRARTSPRLRAAAFALSIAVMAQVGGASTALQPPATTPVAHVSAAGLPVPGGQELLAWLAGVLRALPVSGGWALLVAGVTGAWAIGRQRMPAIGGSSLDPYRLPRR